MGKRAETTPYLKKGLNTAIADAKISTVHNQPTTHFAQCKASSTWVKSQDLMGELCSHNWG